MEKSPLLQFSGLGLKPVTTLVKINKFPQWVEDLLEEKPYDAAAIAARRRKEAEKLGIEFGVLRDGMDDTGFPVINNQKSVIIQPGLEEIRRYGYYCTDPHYFWLEKTHEEEDENGNKVKVVDSRTRMVQLVYNLTGKEIKIPERVLKTLEHPTEYLNVFANLRDGRSDQPYRLDTWNLPYPRQDWHFGKKELHWEAMEEGPSYKHYFTYDAKNIRPEG